MIDSNFIFLRDCLDSICNDIQDRQLQATDPELLRLLDAIYPKLSYSFQRVNNYIIIHKEDKINV